MPNERIFLIHHHHSDLVWRRTCEEYVQVREEQILQVLYLLRAYPEFKFCYAQTPIIDAFLTDHPNLAEEFEHYVRAARIEMVGGLFSIPDTNIPGAESQVRNLLYGSQWVKQHFGKIPKVAWYMDAFGMSAQIPQILAKSGFPYVLPGRTPCLEPEASKGGSFWWEGPDGSRVLAATGRAAVQTLEYVCNLPLTYSREQRMPLSLRGMQELEGDVFAMYCTEEGILREEIMALVQEANAGKGKEIVFANPSEFFEHLAKRAASPEFPVHYGELNPEFSGCYTTRIRIKQGNRAAEEALVSAEKMAALATLVGAAYPREALTQLWRDLMLVHFHDGICGCHIDPVSDHLLSRIERIRSRAESLREAAMTRLAAAIATDADSLVVFNTENWNRTDLVAVEAAHDLEVRDRDGKVAPTQREGGHVLFVADVPSMGYTTYGLRRKSAPGERCPALIGEDAVGFELETPQHRVRVGEKALTITPRRPGPSIFPKGSWIPEVQFREDAGDLWTEVFLGPVFSESFGEVELRRVIHGDVFTQVTYQGCIAGAPDVGGLWDGFVKLRWIKEMFFYRHTDEIHLRLTIDWWGSDTKILLSIPCELDPLTARATYEVPFAAIERKPYFEVPYEYASTLQDMPDSVLNTSKGDWPAVRWVDYSDGRCGMAVANRGTPGHSILGKRICISLLRSGTSKASGFKPPVGSFENGRRVFEFALLPHAGSWEEANAHHTGVAWNNPLLAVYESAHSGRLPASASLMETAGASGVICTALKQAEEGDAIVVRLCEMTGKPAVVSLQGLDFSSRAHEADLFEAEGKEISCDRIELGPYEVKTLRLQKNGST